MEATPPVQSLEYTIRELFPLGSNWRMSGGTWIWTVTGYKKNRVLLESESGVGGIYYTDCEERDIWIPVNVDDV